MPPSPGFTLDQTPSFITTIKYSQDVTLFVIQILFRNLLKELPTEEYVYELINIVVVLIVF